jgi:uncharacterized membrane protein
VLNRTRVDPADDLLDELATWSWSDAPVTPERARGRGRRGAASGGDAGNGAPPAATGVDDDRLDLDIDLDLDGGRRRIARRTVLATIAAVLVLASASALWGIAVPWLSPALGLAAVLGAPLVLIALADPGRASVAGERWLWSLPLTLLSLMGAGLVANTVLPHLGVTDPLSTTWAVVTVDVLCLALGAALHHRYPVQVVLSLPSLRRADRVVLGLGVTVPLLAIAGANRLNNGYGGGVTLAMLVVALGVLGLLAFRAERLTTATVMTTVYLVGLALLLMTSLRGWYTTGHDVQREYLVFQLTKARNGWDMAAYPDAYNACLSITILPTLLLRWVPIDDPYVYKFVFQLVFAAVPVLVLQLARRFTSMTIAVISTVMFLSFVTFFQDMPMLNRQEVGFLFVVACLLAAFRTDRPLRERRAWFCVFGVGMVLAHYSTTYMMIGILVIALGVRLVGRPILRRLPFLRRPRWEGSPLATAGAGLAPVVSVGTVAVLVVAAALWIGPATHSVGGLGATVTAALDSVRGGNDATSRSSDTSYGMFGGQKVTAQQRFDAGRKENLSLTADGRANGDYYPESEIDGLPTPVVDPPEMPLTALGQVLSDAGLDVPAVNSVVRLLSAWLLQVLVVVGVAVVALGRRRRVRPPLDYLELAVATVVVVLIQLVAPVLSVEYGLLRAFQQALIVLDVFIVAGVLACVPRVGERRRLQVAAGAALAFFASSTGIITQSLGGYAPQLHLNNAGTYYDIYYLHPEELAGADWLRHQTQSAATGDIQSEVQTDRYTFTRLADPKQLSRFNDIAPELLRPDAYVFLGYANVTKDQSTEVVASDLVTYRYPTSFLDEHKDLVYSSGGARVYR